MPPVENWTHPATSTTDLRKPEQDMWNGVGQRNREALSPSVRTPAMQANQSVAPGLGALNTTLTPAEELRCVAQDVVLRCLWLRMTAAHEVTNRHCQPVRSVDVN